MVADVKSECWPASRRNGWPASVGFRMVATLLDLERRLTDAALSTADRLIGASFTRGKAARERTFVATSRDVGRLMRLLAGTAGAVATAMKENGDALAAIDAAVGLDRLIAAKPQAAEIADVAEEDPLVRAADRWMRLREYGPMLIEAIDFKAARADDRTIAALIALRDLNRSGKRDLPEGTPMPFKKEWRRLVAGADGRLDHRLFEAALFAHLRNNWRSGDLWVERSTHYRRFDSYLLPLDEARTIVAPLGLPCDVDAWLAARAERLDRRLKRLGRHLGRGTLEGVSLRNGKLSIAPVRAEKNPEAEALAARIGALMPRIRITELLHEVARETGFLSAFTNVRTQQPVEDGSALLAVILADATNLGLSRMAAASQGVTRDQLFWTRDAFIRDETRGEGMSKLLHPPTRYPLTRLKRRGTGSKTADTWCDGRRETRDERVALGGHLPAALGASPAPFEADENTVSPWNRGLATREPALQGMVAHSRARAQHR
ncbi:Tn3 family transposase (plasmid) [Methylobacterium fujisawaense]|uniref:Tn3 family transposase n=1 Tax=Methylobacterium fujisawaense TaxID=107400 RepID=UPI000FDE81BD